MIFDISLIIISISILIAYIFIINDVKRGKYKVKNRSILSEEAENKYNKEFPLVDIKDLKSEIQKVAEILIANKPSNRYTEILRQKAKKDDKIQELKKAKVNNVELIKYVDGVLKSRIKYTKGKDEYSLILNMDTVTSGRVFLNNYYIFKDKIKLEEAC